MSVSPADSNRSAQPHREFDAQASPRKSTDAVTTKRRDVSHVGHAAQDKQQADFERALRHAGDEETSDDEAALEAATTLPGPQATPPQIHRFVARMESRDVPSSRADSRIASALRTQDVTLLRQTALPLVAGNPAQRLQLEFANANIPLRRIDLERTRSGHVDVALTSTHPIGSALDACVDRLRMRLAERGTALGHLHVEPDDTTDDDEANH